MGALLAGVNRVVNQMATNEVAADDVESPETWEPEWLPYVEFVEMTRGLDFEYPVTVERVSIADTLAADRESVEEDISWLEPYVALGLVDADVSYSDEMANFESNWVLAYYDSELDTIYIPEGELTLVVASSLVHELTHALQDQHEMIDVDFFTTDEYVGHRALVEGDADWVEARWEAQLSLAESDEIAAEYAAMDAEAAGIATGDPYLENMLASPYWLGDPAVELIYYRGGQSAMDRLLKNGPGSSEYLIDPLGSTLEPVGGKRLVATPENADEGSASWSDSLGAVDLYNMLTPLIGAEAAIDAVMGYDDDRYLPYQRDGENCVAMVVWTDTTVDAEELRLALVASGAADVDTGTFGKPSGPGVTFTACDSTPVNDPATQSANQLGPLVVLNWMLFDHLQNGVEDEVARCAAKAQASALAIDVLPDWETIVADSSAAVVACQTE